MKHQWRTDGDGEVKPLNEDADHPVAVCRICGTTSGCLHAAPDCPAIGAEPLLDADDCAGVDRTVVVTVSIRHPGKATEWNDRAGASMSKEIPLPELLDAVGDPVLDSLATMVEVISNGWRGVRTVHESAWRAAVEAAGSSVSGAKAADHG